MAILDGKRIMGGLEKARSLQEAGRGAGRSTHRSPDENSQRLMTGEAWEDFCSSLRDAGRMILDADQPDDPRVRALGFRYLLGLVKFGASQAAELSQRRFPKFIRFEDSFVKWGAENADNHYICTHIDSGQTYRIRGTRGTCMTFLIEVREGFMQLGDTRDFANLTADELEISEDGSFEIIASRQEHPGNWLPLDPEARQIVIRQYFGDWEREEPATFEILREGGQGESPPALEAHEMASILDDAGNWVETSTRFWGEWLPELRENYRHGEIVPARRYVGGADDIYYGNDYYRIAADEALVIEFTPPRAKYWAFQLCDLWFVSTDYVNRTTSLNNSQAVLDSDGKCRIVVAHEDPRVCNWIDTAGATEGVLQYRYVWTKDNPLPEVRNVKFEDLAAVLPEGVRTISPVERKRQIAVRQQAVRLRERVA
ncbi:MAG: DUF1214 domain-containing protein [Myxococcota bacterium]